MAHLFEPLQLRDLILSNRIGIPPMCQYTAKDGMAEDWHFVHYGSRAIGGAALMLIEATAVSPEGRISLGDLGIWNDNQIEPLAHIANFSKKQGCAPAIQLAHAGRKASVGIAWQDHGAISVEEGGWAVIAPSPVPYDNNYAVPHELDQIGINKVITQFSAGARRAREAGFQAIEIHAAHGYLLHQFLSPLSNFRTDGYGGSFKNRIRIVQEVVSAVRTEWPDRLPLLIRLSATDWIEGGWSLEQTIELCQLLKGDGVDLIDVSSAGLLPTPKIPVGPGFQTNFAMRVRYETGIPTAAVGMITSPEQADHVIRSGQADIVLIGREILRNPNWPLSAAQALGQKVSWPLQYLRAAPFGSVGR